MVLRAFNAELSQIPDSVKQEGLVQIRMQWWREAVKSAYSDRPEPNPIILALHEVNGRRNHSSIMPRTDTLFLLCPVFLYWLSIQS